MANVMHRLKWVRPLGRRKEDESRQ